MPVPSVERPVSALRQRMREVMAMRGRRFDTQHEYMRFVRSFAAFLGQPHRSPHSAVARHLPNNPLLISISANRWMSGSRRCSGMFGIDS